MVEWSIVIPYGFLALFHFLTHRFGRYFLVKPAIASVHEEFCAARGMDPADINKEFVALSSLISERAIQSEAFLLSILGSLAATVSLAAADVRLKTTALVAAGISFVLLVFWIVFFGWRASDSLEKVKHWIMLAGGTLYPVIMLLLHGFRRE